MFDDKHHQVIADVIHRALCQPRRANPGAGVVVSALCHLFSVDNPEFDAYAFTRAIRCDEP